MKARILETELGYYAQVKRWFYPFWLTVGSGDAPILYRTNEVLESNTYDGAKQRLLKYYQTHSRRRFSEVRYQGELENLWNDNQNINSL